MIKRFGTLDHAAYVHVRAVVALLIVAIIVGWFVWRRRDDRGLVVPALWFIPFFIAQVVIGEVQWRNQLPWEVVWGVTFFLSKGGGGTFFHAYHCAYIVN